MMVLAAGWWGDFIGWLEGHEASALVLAAFLTFSATVILAVVTAFYAGSAKRQAVANVKMAEEMLRQRLIGVQPIVVPSFEIVGYYGIQARVENVGAGPSFDLSVLVENLDRGMEVDEGHNVQVLKPGEQVTVDFQPRHVFEERTASSGQQNVHAFPTGKYRFIASYYDLYGNRLSGVRLFELVESSAARLEARLGNMRFSGYETQASGKGAP